MLSDVTDLAALGPRWRALEARAGGSFFQSWSWVGCLAAERFPDPVLLSLPDPDGQDAALALFNRRGKTLWLGENGTKALDAIYIEHNGVLLAPNATDRLADCLRHAAQGRQVVLSGVDDAHLAAARTTPSMLRLQRSQKAPFIDLTSIGPGTGTGTGPDAYLATLGAGTRYQIRRSARHHATRGPLAIWRATEMPEALAVLDDLARLHQTSWTARGQPGAFANPNFRRFHTALIERAFPRGEIDLLRITAGDHLVGCLYNFRHNGDVLAYQSGFDYAAAGPHEKPGMTCHHLAIEQARADGMRRYDFLAGESRYKTSLAQGATLLHWLDLLPPWSPQALLTRLRNTVQTR